MLRSLAKCGGRVEQRLLELGSVPLSGRGFRGLKGNRYAACDLSGMMFFFGSFFGGS